MDCYKTSIGWDIEGEGESVCVKKRDRENSRAKWSITKYIKLKVLGIACAKDFHIYSLDY